MLPFGTKPCKVGFVHLSLTLLDVVPVIFNPLSHKFLKTLMTLQNSQVVLAHQNGMFWCCNWLVAL